MPEIVEVVEIDGDPYGVAVDAAGMVWCTLAERGAIARWDGAQLETFGLEPADGSPTVILADGKDLWFTEFRGNRIGRIGPGGACEFLPADSPYGLCVAPDGALWYTELNANAVVRRDPGGALDRYAVEGMPSTIAAGPDGTVWFTLNQANAIGRITAAGVLTVQPLPTEAAAPVGITARADGAWFVEIGAGQLGHIPAEGAATAEGTATAGGTVTEFPLPDRAARPHAVVAGPDGALWFTEWASSRLGRMTVDGTVTGLSLPGAEPHGLTFAPDGSIWVAMESGALVRVRPDTVC
ncbi:Vgb family protein [Nocardia shimofusensis]|uniref:Vgb family protein n=1 Tax=Nocardia shimofusensis TaxID=228596 RepID=UPI00082B3340|nr:virginiamycin B lyase [Nocardia shimofusensis]